MPRPTDPNPLAAIHAARNRDTRGDRDAYATHRARVTRLLIEAGRDAHVDRLCVLGAGNGNDLEPALLAQGFAHVALVDVDADALHHAAQRWRQDRLALVPEFDVTGVLDAMRDTRADDDTSIDALHRAIQAAQPAVSGGPYNVVASTCMLSQVLGNVVATLGRSHPRLASTMLALRRAHLELMYRTLATGGRGLLITDYVSSVNRPDLPTIPPAALANAMRDAVARKQFMTGTNPAAIHAHLTRDQAWADRVEHVTVDGPWAWWIGSKTFAVSAIGFTRRA